MFQLSKTHTNTHTEGNHSAPHDIIVLDIQNHHCCKQTVESAYSRMMAPGFVTGSMAPNENFDSISYITHIVIQKDNNHCKDAHLCALVLLALELRCPNMWASAHGIHCPTEHQLAPGSKVGEGHLGLTLSKSARFVRALQPSLVGMGFDSKCNFAPPTVLLGLLLCPWTWGIFFGVSQHSPVDGCSAASCNFGVLPGDEHMSFYSAISKGKMGEDVCYDQCILLAKLC